MGSFVELNFGSDDGRRQGQGGRWYERNKYIYMASMWVGSFMPMVILLFIDLFLFCF